MPLNAGDLNRRITIEERAAGEDAAGQPNGAWEEFGQAWADIRSPSGLSIAEGERVAGGGEVSPYTVSMRIRWRTGITAGMRVTCSIGGVDMVFDIKRVSPDLRNREHIDLVCETGASEG